GVADGARVRAQDEPRRARCVAQVQGGDRAWQRAAARRGVRDRIAVHEGQRGDGRRERGAARVHGEARAGLHRKAAEAMSALEGVRVVEMGLWVAGPSAGGILADWGADVIKIEMPSGDPMRTLYSALSGSKETRCPPFDLHNRGKRSVAIDVNHSRGRDA